MQLPICSRCKKNVAVVFITKFENNKNVNEGLCLKCAKELGIKPVSDLMDKMGISNEDLEGMSEEMMNFPMADLYSEDDDDLDEDGDNNMSAKSPFLSNLFPGTEFEEDDEDILDDDTPKARKKRAKKKKFLDNYAINLTQKAADGLLDNVIGRDSEIARVIQILNRRQKSNPCLIGEPGVGKTAIAEALAIKIHNGEVPYKLKNKELYLLDLTALVAGTQFRGQFESRIKALVSEVKRLGNIILVIDEVHNLVGIGDSEGSMNAANILKPALSRGEIQVIGATTFSEYRKHIEKDAALERRFQPVMINEPTVDEAITMIKGIRKYYEAHHGVTISDDVVESAVLLSERYITDRFLPDKAIDLIDEACSSINLKNKNLERLQQIKGEISENVNEQERLSENPDDTAIYEKIANLKSRKFQLDNEYAELEDKAYAELTEQDLANVVELWTKIPASRVCTQEFKQLAELAENLKKRIIGQDEAINTVAAAIKRNRAGISAKRKPVSFIFVGPTGVGKTELVKCLAQELFNSQDALIRLDMSEYMEKHSVSKIIGSPPGYVGYDEAGQLTEKIRRNPYSVVLFDEIEKAHPDVLNILLQILDDGLITDSKGRRINFENTIIIMTSNAGSDKKGGSSVGFGRSVSELGKENAMKALSEIMRPEFINRVDEIILFNQLSEQDFSKICAIVLSELQSSLKSHGIKFTYDPSVVEYISSKSFSIKYGARNLRRTIQKELEDNIASLIINSYDKPVIGVHAYAEDGSIQIKALN